MTFDEKLAKALEESFDERMERRMRVEKKHRFSLAYRLWEYRTLKDLRKKQSNGHWTLRKARFIVMAAIIALSLLAGTSAYAVGVAVVRANTDYSRLFFESLSSDRTVIEEYYGLNTKDWDLMKHNISDTEIVLSYENYKNREKTIRLSQKLITEDTVNAYAENRNAEPIDIFESKDGLYISRDNGDCSLLWFNDGYLFELRGNIAKNEAADLAVSTKNIIMIFLD